MLDMTGVQVQTSNILNFDESRTNARCVKDCKTKMDITFVSLILAELSTLCVLIL